MVRFKANRAQGGCRHLNETPCLHTTDAELRDNYPQKDAALRTCFLFFNHLKIFSVTAVIKSFQATKS